MCGRFAFFANNNVGYESLQLPAPPSFESYNIAPSQDILAIRISPETGQPEYTLLRWGLLPFWSKTSKTKFPMINARAEGIEKKPSFRGPFKDRRCIIPASGFYEWQKSADGKQPFFIRPANGGVFGLAGIWDHWQGEGKTIESCSIITTTSNAIISEIHDRMPVILEKGVEKAWLDTETEQAQLLAMLSPYPKKRMEVYPVSSFVNNPRNNGPECIERLGKQQRLFPEQDMES